MSHSNAITARLLIEVPKAFPDRIRLWRTNTGGGIGMSTVKQIVSLLHAHDIEQAIELLTKRPMKWGVVGGPDVTGIIGPNARFLGIEVKDKHEQQSEEQINFQRMSESLGGIYIICRFQMSVEDAVGETIATLRDYMVSA